MADTLEPEDKRGDELLAACLQTLIAHFDTVRIVVTSHDSDRSEMKSVGAGNLYAQKGSVESWLDEILPGQNEEEE